MQKILPNSLLIFIFLMVYSFPGVHLAGTYAASRSLGYGTFDSLQFAYESVLPDLVNMRLGFLYDTEVTGFTYADHHLYSGISDDEKNEILIKNAKNFVLFSKNNQSGAGKFLHVFGDLHHQNAPHGNFFGNSLSNFFNHQKLDFDLSNSKVTGENIIKYVSRELNNEEF